MNDTSFIDLLNDDNIKKINIDPTLIEPFRNIMKRMQEMVEMARQQKIQQDLINSQEETEEDQGMSL